MMHVRFNFSFFWREMKIAPWHEEELHRKNAYGINMVFGNTTWLSLNELVDNT